MREFLDPAESSRLCSFRQGLHLMGKYGFNRATIDAWEPFEKLLNRSAIPQVLEESGHGYPRPAKDPSPANPLRVSFYRRTVLPVCHILDPAVLIGLNDALILLNTRSRGKCGGSIWLPKRTPAPVRPSAIISGPSGHGWEHSCAARLSRPGLFTQRRARPPPPPASAAPALWRGATGIRRS